MQFHVLEDCSMTPTTIGIPLMFMFHNFFSSLATSRHFYHLLFENFSHQRQLMVFHWSLSNSWSPQVSRTLLSILVVLNNVVVWMVSTHPFIFKSSSPCTNPLVTVSKATIKIGIIATFMFHSFFNSLARSKFLSFFSLSILFCGQPG